jgi:hypothetical protein
MLEKLVAELNCDFGMSAKAMVLRLVNCIERHKPFTNNTARITMRGVRGKARNPASAAPSEFH